MTFFNVVTRGLRRRPVRTGLTLIGISIGIAAVVALVGIARGFEKSWETGLKKRGTDVVFSNMSSSLTPSPFPDEVRDRIAKVPGVAGTSTLLVELMSIESSQMTMLSAREWGSFGWQNLKVVSGRMIQDDKEPAVLLGNIAAEVLGKKVGDPIQIETRELTVVGIVDGGAVVENGSIIMALPLLQDITGNEKKVNVIDVRLAPGTAEAQARDVCAAINKAAPEGRAMLVSEHLSNSQGYKMIRAMSWGTSLLAVLVGVLGVMNTMLMTVFERTKEICILLAVGWRRLRVVRMILWESALLGFLGGVGGVLLGTVGVKIMQSTKAIRGLLEPDLSIELLGVSVGIAVIVGIISGIYPAWRSSRLSPALALHS